MIFAKINTFIHLHSTSGNTQNYKKPTFHITHTNKQTKTQKKSL